MECIPWTLHSLIDHFSQGVDAIGIVACQSSILDVVTHRELFEALGASVVNVLGVGNELRRRRRSVRGRHFEWRTG